MEKEKRGLSGIYFRHQNEDTKKWDNVVFEDLSEAEQDRIMEGRDIEWLRSLAKQLGNTLNEIGNQLDLVSQNEVE